MSINRSDEYLSCFIKRNGIGLFNLLYVQIFRVKEECL